MYLHSVHRLALEHHLNHRYQSHDHRGQEEDIGMNIPVEIVTVVAIAMKLIASLPNREVDEARRLSM